MVVEELIAKLGFKVEGADQIKKFDKALENAKKSVEDFGKSANKALAGNSTTNNPLKGMTAGMGQATTAGDKFRAFVDRLRAGATTTAVSMARFGMSVASVLSRIAGGAAIVGTMAVALFKMAAAAALAASKAAILRREQQMAARGNRTTAANIDKLAAGFEAVGIEGDKAKDLTTSIAEKVNESIAGKGNGGELTKTTGVPVMDARHRQRDSTAIALDIMKWGFDRRKAAEDARFASDQLKPGDKGYKAALAKADRLETANRKDFEAAGIFNTMYSLPEGLTFKDFERKMKERNALNPPPTKAQEDRSAFIADQAGQLKAALDALAKPLQDAKESILINVLPPLNGFANALIALGKAFGLINETAEEIAAKKTARESVAKTAKDINENPQDYKDDKTLWGALARKMKEAGQAAQPSADVPTPPSRSQLLPDNPPLPPRRAPMPGMGSFKSSSDDVISSLAAFAGALRAATDDVTSRNGPAAAAKDANAKIENDQRKYENIGNDQRTISVNTTVNQTVTGASAPAAAGAAVSSAASAATQKASNASTAAATSP